MERGVRASLSPNEERILRRIAAGEDQPPAREVEQLKKLHLVEEAAHGLRLTAIGRERHARLPAEAQYKASSPDKINEVLANFFTSARR